MPCQFPPTGGAGGKRNCKAGGGLFLAAWPQQRPFTQALEVGARLPLSHTPKTSLATPLGGTSIMWAGPASPRSESALRGPSPRTYDTQTSGVEDHPLKCEALFHEAPSPSFFPLLPLSWGGALCGYLCVSSRFALPLQTSHTCITNSLY